MAYQSLYRKYRPQTFADVMGQGHVVRTLQNALASGRIAHGYLFTGTRGTAKTTVARLVAKALNCESDSRPVSEPCNRCEACRSITAGTSTDVIEMDAASHRGVADIEEVRKAVGYGPMQFRYKVFIIDEAHQLSSDAKDAFLKTLEEPPANVVFILATTEPQAIPITIRSRCQQFDFKRGSLAEITARLRYVLESEGVTYEAPAVTLVARGAEGSYRDSLSLLEQVLAFTPAHVTAASVETVLGTLDTEMLSRVVHAVAERNAPETFALAGQILDAGKEARSLLRTLSLHFRDLMLVSVGGPAVSVELTQDEVQRLQVEARLFTPQQMMRAMDILNEAQGETRWNNQHRLLTELTFLKLMNLGGVQEEAKAFQIAPIVFSATPIAPPPVAAPVREVAEVRPAPVPEARVAVTPTPVVAQTTPTVPRSVRVAVETKPALPQTVPPESAPEEEETLAASFFADDAPSFSAFEFEAEIADDAEEADEAAEDFATLTEADVVAAPVVPVAEVVIPVVVPVVDAAPIPVPAEPVEEEWELFPDVPQEGPGLFDEPGAVPEPAVTPTPAIAAARPPEPIPQSVPSDSRKADREPLFPTPREGNPQPPAPSLESAEEPTESLPIPPMTAEPSASISTTEPSLEDLAPIVTLSEVRQAWPTFLRQADRISRKTALFLRDSEPMQIAGRVVVIMIANRAYHEMLTEKPEAQSFIRKLLARILGKEGIGVRLELDPTLPPAAKRVPGGDSQKKRRYDRFAAIETIEGGPSGSAAASPSSYGSEPGSFGWSGGGGRTTPEAPSEFPPPVAEVRSAPVRETIVAPPVRQAEPSGFIPPAVTPSPNGTNGAAPVAVSSEQKRGIALAEPLVQEVLMVFGGDIVIE